jgi:hypothetical protein
MLSFSKCLHGISTKLTPATSLTIKKVILSLPILFVKYFKFALNFHFTGIINKIQSVICFSSTFYQQNNNIKYKCKFKTS